MLELNRVTTIYAKNERNTYRGIPGCRFQFSLQANVRQLSLSQNMAVKCWPTHLLAGATLPHVRHLPAGFLITLASFRLGFFITLASCWPWR